MLCQHFVASHTVYGDEKSCILFPFSFRGIKSVCLGTRAWHMRTEKSSANGAEWCLLLFISLAWLQGLLVSFTLLSVCMYVCMSISVGAQLYVGACVQAITLERHSSGTWFLTQGLLSAWNSPTVWLTSYLLEMGSQVHTTPPPPCLAFSHRSRELDSDPNVYTVNTSHWVKHSLAPGLNHFEPQFPYPSVRGEPWICPPLWYDLGIQMGH